jgi:hypothetical protein
MVFFIYNFGEDPAGKYTMIGSKMIYQSLAMVCIFCSRKNTFKESFNTKVSLVGAVQACMKLNMSLLMADDIAKVTSIVTAVAGI